MRTWHGIAVSPGVIVGPALVLGTEVFRIPQRFVHIDAVESEIGRFHSAMEQVYEEIAQNEELASNQLGAQYGAIFAAHLQMVRDPRLIGEIEEFVQEKNYSPEFATSRVLRKYAKVFQNLGNNYMAERAADIFDLEKRILRNLLGESREELATLKAPVIVLASNLTPSETANLNKEFVMGFATERGGQTSHTAILAGALEIPAVVGVGKFLAEISGGETIIIDGNRGKVILDPDEESLEEYRQSEERQRTVAERRLSLGSILPITTDGTRIQVLGNIEFPDEAEHCTRRGADGIGLYRTEFLYLERNHEPTEDDHYEAYCQVLRSFPDQPVIIRTIDLGADKVPGSMEQIFQEVPNPVLGLRSIRLCLKNQPLFKTQLRAILRAAVNGDVKIMFPLVTTLGELRHAKMILKDVQEELEEESIPFCADVSVGMMVEVPAAAILAKEFAKEVDFFSIGTNDLVQYTLAVDRADLTVADLYNAADPSILWLIRNVVEAANSAGIPVTVCGQMSSEPIFIPLLIGMGLRQLSATPHTIPELKEIIRSLSVQQAEEIAQHAVSLDNAGAVERYLRAELIQMCPDIVI